MFLIYSLVKIGLTSSDLPLIKLHSIFTMTFLVTETIDKLTWLKKNYVIDQIRVSKLSLWMGIRRRFKLRWQSLKGTVK